MFSQLEIITYSKIFMEVCSISFYWVWEPLLASIHKNVADRVGLSNLHIDTSNLGNDGP